MRWTWLVLLGACSFTPNRLAGDAAHGMPPDGTPIGSDSTSEDAAPACYGTGVVQICPAAAPSGTLVLSGTLDTATASACKAYGVPSGQHALDACVVAANSVVVTGSFVVTGARPLVVIGAQSIEVAPGSVLDVSSRRSPARTGAGALHCDAQGNATCGFTNCGGGPGGSFAAIGGEGGDGANGDGKGGRPSSSIATLDVLRGGCGGAAGGGIFGGGGGGGGGAVALLSAGTITIDGAIDASGGGGSGASGFAAGGGGGGAGGMIVLDAPMLAGAGTLIANGGGGGEGASTMIPGASGGEAAVATPLTAAPGGEGNSNAGNGGAGAAGGTVQGGDGTDGTSGDGGGGGGGGAGVIQLYATQDGFTGAQSP
jgi:hypothetical protein